MQIIFIERMNLIMKFQADTILDYISLLIMWMVIAEDELH